MIVDSTTLPEQLVKDAIRSAFGSADQCCSALRVLFVQDDIADKLIKMLARAELVVGNFAQLHTDVGPVIDQLAKQGLQDHADHMTHTDTAKLIYQCPLDSCAPSGSFFAPRAFEISHLSQLVKEE